MNGLDREYWCSACEVAELAAEVEEKGVAFYGRLASEVGDGTVRNMCVFFAGQEQEHRLAFRGIAGHFRDKTVEFSYSIDIRAMLRSSMDEIVTLFSGHANRLSDGVGIAGYLALAQRIEQVSVEVYGRMRKVYTEPFAAVLAKIVAEEAEHLRMVQSVRASL